MGVGLEMIQKLIVTLFVLVAVTLAWSASPARELARLLAEKGLISQSDLSRVEQVDAEQSVRLLTSILQKEGIDQRNRSGKGPERSRGPTGGHGRVKPAGCRGRTAAPAEADCGCGRFRNSAIQVPRNHLWHAAMEFVL
jgi:hypothetical protein